MLPMAFHFWGHIAKTRRTFPPQLQTATDPHNLGGSADPDSSLQQSDTFCLCSSVQQTRAVCSCLQFLQQTCSCLQLFAAVAVCSRLQLFAAVCSRPQQPSDLQQEQQPDLKQKQQEQQENKQKQKQKQKQNDNPMRYLSSSGPCVPLSLSAGFGE
ncbi:hypothetical protein CBR_g1002 [Chara braunii]|uniref:Uncharacterized protein n=1 Tax=Chara braunii TaxID=69332 RepID=A0A388KD54_CHABU|nr:hypothetical protein CBR_g1002 [Chara braunii]|eukprot:GBG67883.1 hypothetical protein CBR_g1002 [Chara braunii]